MRMMYVQRKTASLNADFLVEIRVIPATRISSDLAIMKRSGLGNLSTKKKGQRQVFWLKI